MKPTAGGALLVSAGAAHRRTLADLLRKVGYSLLDAAEFGDARPDLIVVVAESDGDDFTRYLAAGDMRTSPPAIVFGPAKAKQWRKTALQAGAFACLSLQAPVEEKIGLLAAAGRYRAAQREIEMLRKEADIVIQGLLESFGAEAEKLQNVVQEAENVRETLEDVQNRIIRSML